MAINLIENPGTSAPITSGDYNKQNALLAAGAVPQASILTDWASVAAAPLLKHGAFIKYEGNYYQVQGADEAISGSISAGINYIALTLSGTVLSASWTNSLTGYLFDAAYGGYYNSDTPRKLILTDICYLFGTEYRRGMSNVEKSLFYLNDGTILGRSGDWSTSGGDILTGAGTIDSEGGIIQSGGGTIDTEGGAILTGAGTIDSEGGIIKSGAGTIDSEGGIIKSGAGTIDSEGGFIKSGGGTIDTEGGAILTGAGTINTEGGAILTGNAPIFTQGGDIDSLGGNILSRGGLIDSDGGNILSGGADIGTEGGDIGTSGGDIGLSEGSIIEAASVSLKEIKPRSPFGTATSTSISPGGFATLSQGVWCVSTRSGAPYSFGTGPSPESMTVFSDGTERIYNNTGSTITIYYRKLGG